MKADSIVVKQSQIHGKGVFAARDFKKGEIVLRWNTTQALTPDEAKKLLTAGNPFVAFIEGKYCLVQEPERFVNHSCEANTTFVDLTDVAKRDIAAGEEITADYTENSAPSMNMKCQCGTRSCRKLITV